MFWYCEACGVLWYGTSDSRCWLCGGRGTHSNDNFVYSPPTSSMKMISEL